MKGWVYVITNKAMPGLVKVGYTLKTPELRAAELNHTGAPHPYRVEYEAFVEEPFSIEQKTHRVLSHLKEGEQYQKGVGVEWFKCSIEEAISAIKTTANNAFISDSYKGADRKKSEEFHRKKMMFEAAKKQLEEKINLEEEEIAKVYQQKLESQFPAQPFWVYWIGGATICFFIVATFLPKEKAFNTFLLCVIGGGFLSGFLKSYFEDKKKNSVEYISIEKRRDEELDENRKKLISIGIGYDDFKENNTTPIKGRSHDQGKVGAILANSIDSIDYNLKLAEQGDVKAQIKLGTMYHFGQGVPKDSKEAIKWFMRAANQGNAHGQNIIGTMYNDGCNQICQDHKEAVKWLRLAADQGNLGAQYSLGVNYYHGRGVFQDYKEAIKWFRLAADKGKADAQFNIGIMHRYGQGVRKDDKEAVKWFKLAADQGHSDAKKSLKFRY